MMARRLIGAHNISNFRKIVEKGAIPKKKDITIEGLFNSYYFDFGTASREVKELAEPTYSIAQIPNWYTGEIEQYIGLSLASSEDGKDHREPLNCVVVLDISGSMGSFFDVDYNDGPIYREVEGQFVTTKKTKMEIANECLVELLKNMKDDENFGVLLFDEKVDVLQPLRKVSLIDRNDLEEKIMKIQPRGGTNMEIGLRTAVEMIEDQIKETTSEESVPKNHRVIFLTDAQPNEGGGPGTLIEISKRAAMKSKIYTTFIGIGLDFNSALIDDLTKIRGSNYFSVHSGKEFRKILNEDFNYMVTPLVLNCNLFFESEGLEVEKCFGTPHEHSGILMSIKTVSASPKDERGIKGGIVVIKLKDKLTPKMEPSKVGKLTLQYITADKLEKKIFVHEIALGEKFEEMKKESILFNSNGVRKAVLLVQFCDMMRATIDLVETRLKNEESEGESCEEKVLIKEEKQSRLSPNQVDDLKRFKTHFMKELEELEDNSLSKELDIIDRLIYQC